jgi:hypothetical protein
VAEIVEAFFRNGTGRRGIILFRSLVYPEMRDWYGIFLAGVMVDLRVSPANAKLRRGCDQCARQFHLLYIGASVVLALFSAYC